MKKVLILAYDFPPYVSVGGLRPYSWYKYFHEFGLYPVVVTRQWGNKYGNHLDYIAPGESDETIVEESETGTIIRTAYKPNLSNRLLLKYGERRFRLLRKAITAYYEFMQFLFFIGPKAGLYRGAKQYLKQHQVDAIIATGAPHILFKYAAKLSKKHNIPWIADYRDPWSQSKSRNRGGYLKQWNQFFERAFTKNASLITTVSEFFSAKIKTLLRNKSIVIILNGYDNQFVQKSEKNLPDSSQLTISFAGTIYKWHPINSVFKTLEKFLSENEAMNLRFILWGTNKKEYYKNYVNTNYPRLSEKIIFNDRVSNSEFLPLLSQSHLMLLFNDYSIIGTKIYDYLATKRQILFCYSKETVEDKTIVPYYNDNSAIFNDHIQEDVLRETNSGIIVKNSDDLFETIKRLYSEFKITGSINCENRNIDKYSRYHQTEKLSKIINEIIAK
jgi:hypothetical protein